MLSKRYESLGDSLVHKQWHSPSGLKYTKRLLVRCVHHFKADLINNMDRMRISGTEPNCLHLLAS